MVTLNFMANFDAIGEIIGTVEGLNGVYSSADYLDNLANDAHNDASMDFDVEISAMAGAGRFNHVYEFGVAGITAGPGDPVRIADPRSEAARLWIHNMFGRDGNYQIDYVFRPAVIPNPKPTTATTGVPQKYLKHISRRKYVFRNKAFIMESGAQVEIRPQRGPLLFVPFYGKSDDGRSFMMYDAQKNGALESRPGRYTRGTFEAFWATWWETIGVVKMRDQISRNVAMDTQYALEEADRRASLHRAELVRAQSLASTMSSARAKTASVMIKRSKSRRGGKRRR